MKGAESASPVSPLLWNCCTFRALKSPRRPSPVAGHPVYSVLPLREGRLGATGVLLFFREPETRSSGRRREI